MSAAELLAMATRAVRDGRLAEAEALFARVLAAEPGNAEALRALGVLEFQAGRYAAAEQRTRQLLALRPRDPAVHFALGLVLQRQGGLEEAAVTYQAALAIDPSHLGSLIALGELQRIQGRFDQAVVLARKAVAVAPRDGEAASLLGSALQGRGDNDEAIAWFETTVARRPDSARAHYNLGVCLQALKRWEEALAAYRRAVQLDPKLMEARNNLGLLLVDAEQPSAAIDHLRIAVDLSPGSAVAHNSLGRAFYTAGQFDRAAVCFERALQIDPGYAEALANLGAVQRSLADPEAALASLDRALAVKPDLADAHGNRSMVLRDLGRLDEAAASAMRAIAARPDEAEFHMALALAHNDRGFHREAVASCRQAIALKPDSATLHRRLLGLLLYSPVAVAADRFAECRDFGARFRRAQPAPDFAHRLRDPERRLRVGYVSSDWRGDHPVARNLRPIFEHHDRTRFEIFAYAGISAPDRTTDHFKRLADGWRVTEGLGDAELAAAIREDRIDILVVLAGRFDRNRPLVASYRPAPVQVSFHDPATSGLDEMDYLLADRTLAPPDGTERFTERVVRLPYFYVHEPLAGAPPVGPLPLAATGAPTLGCFNNPAKLSDDCLALWARLLERIPRARLVLRFRNWYRSEALQRRISAAFDTRGIARDRLTFLADERPDLHHLDVYNSVDVALDPLPFTGSTTTFEALWMGVPVVTLIGDTMVSRWTASILGAVRLERLAVSTPDRYIGAVADLVSDDAALAALRASLRGRVAASSLCDGKGRTRQVERMYRAFWRRACAVRGSGLLAVNLV